MTMTRSEAGRLGYLKSKDVIQKKFEERKQEYLKNPKLCKYCSCPLSYYDKKIKKAFCNSSCAAFFNKNRKQKNYNTCANCSSQIEKPNKYCSSECQYNYKTNIKIKNKSFKTDAALKRYLKKTRPHMCESCQNTDWMGQSIPLQMDHIDGNSENQDLSNLRLLCPNCHAQTPTFGAKNRGNGRHLRRQRYREGKSF